MNHFKKALLTTLIGTTLVAGAHAADNANSEALDASDMTRAYSTFYVGASNNGDVKASGSISYQYENGMESMFSLEGTMNKEGEYSDSRFQYFHVFNTGNSVSPRVAVSLDVVDNDTATTAALGAISIFRTPIDSLTFFARVGALTGTYSDQSMSAFNVTDDSLVGGMGAAYAVWKTGQDGTFLALYPEVTYLSGDIDSTTVKTTLMAATPLSTDKTRWGQVKFENTSGSMESSSKHVDINENRVWFNYKVYL
ncbi:hypothetical protein [Vibrio vulnificus]|uniref:hypothetical protein n=1 Tax=Vibrio vulnificus TaxID=672 RepID=UPI0001F5C345|nr:hypothetical protein [Vibrio vulnificus]ADV89289.1 hypothetical protein VVMO6_04267 [Vibrio vulnificus MO6-24/O]EGR0039360.1 hypothetical protein [Vibrio vulnificus]EGR0093115.1 hypothetical protein [Vibrio vulnificus]EGR0096892.1 hypothetical protein [Vibrio vulnificus]EGR7941776.1 hypothetical protein [Vibrio vulnificus]